MNSTPTIAVQKILETLGVHLRASKRIGEIEAEVGRSRGYFSKVAAGKWRISIDVLLHTLAVLEVEPAAFFAEAFAEPEPVETERTDPSHGPRNDRVRNVADFSTPSLDPTDFPWRR